METTKAISLKDRILWYDGDSTVSEPYITERLSKGESTNGLRIAEMTPAIAQFNALVDPSERITVKTEVADVDLSFNLPEEYEKLDVDAYVAEKFFWEAKNNNFTDEEHNRRVARAREEILLYEDLNLFNVLRTLIYIINTLRDRNIVWGVGRGSSVASYILYLIGVHDVDSVKYDLNISDFLRAE